MKLAFFSVKPWEQAYLSEKLAKHTLVFCEGQLTPGTIKRIKECEVLSVFIYTKVTEKALAQLPKLKLVTTMSTGFDHIDIDACKKRGIAVCNVPYYGENTVAEHTFALLLSLSRHIHQSYVRTTHDNYSIDGLTGFDLKGKTIGIIGGGHIGIHVARMAKGFEMNVLVFDTHENVDLARSIGFAYAPMNTLLKLSDIVSLHVPYNTHTAHLINAKTIALMKKGAVLINTARGGLVDTDALYSALKKKHLAGAGLDVIEGEELLREEHPLAQSSEHADAWRSIVRNHDIFKMPNVVFTPHNAFNSTEALIRILDTTVDNVKGLTKKNMVNKVN